MRVFYFFGGVMAEKKIAEKKPDTPKPADVKIPEAKKADCCGYAEIVKTAKPCGSCFPKIENIVRAENARWR